MSRSTTQCEKNCFCMSALADEKPCNFLDGKENKLWCHLAFVMSELVCFSQVKSMLLLEAQRISSQCAISHILSELKSSAEISFHNWGFQVIDACESHDSKFLVQNKSLPYPYSIQVTQYCY